MYDTPPHDDATSYQVYLQNLQHITLLLDILYTKRSGGQLGHNESRIQHTNQPAYSTLLGIHKKRVCLLVWQATSYRVLSYANTVIFFCLLTVHQDTTFSSIFFFQDM